MVFSQYVVDVLKMPLVPFTKPLDVAELLAHNSSNIYIFIWIVECQPTVLLGSFENL